MLATLAQRPIPRALPLGLDLDSKQEQEAESMSDWPWLAGFPAPAPDDIESSLHLDEHLVRHPESTFLVRVTGAALADAGLHDGDLLVLDQATPPLAGAVVLVSVEGVAVLTRLRRNAQGRLMLQSAESNSDQPLGGAMIVGVARWAIHRLWPGRIAS